MSSIDNFIDRQRVRLITDEYEEDLPKYFKKFGVSITVTKREVCGQWLKFTIKLKGRTRATHVCARTPDVQDRLKCKRLRFVNGAHEKALYVTDQEPEYDSLKTILTGENYLKTLRRMELPHVIGFNFIGQRLEIDLAESIHLLMGGASGSGKSVALQVLITTIAYLKTPAEVNFILIDTGATDLMCFEGLPHLSCPIIQGQGGAIRALNAVMTEMDRRIKLEHMAPDEYALLPRLVVVIDEYPAIFAGMDGKKRKTLSDTVSALLQRGRHAKIHMVLAAQNPTIRQMKAEIGNITTRIAFRCAKKNASEIILGEGGAEKLAGHGELLLVSPHYEGIKQLQGVYASHDELRQLVNRIKHRHYEVAECESKFMIPCASFDTENNMGADTLSIPVKVRLSVDDRTFANVLLWTLSRDVISVNALMDKFHMGWSKAEKLVKRLNELGVVGELDAKLPRPVVPTEIGDLPEQMLDFLRQNGVSGDEIIGAITQRNNRAG